MNLSEDMLDHPQLLSMLLDLLFIFTFLGAVFILLICCLLLFRFNEFGEDGGPAAKEWAPKLALVKKYIDGIIGKNNFHIDVNLQ